MRARVIFALLLLTIFSCSKKTQNGPEPGGPPPGPGPAPDPDPQLHYVKISQEHSSYFTGHDGKTWVPITTNFIADGTGNIEETFTYIEEYFRRFSSNGGNSVRIWISSPLYEIESDKAGEYNEEKFKRIDRLLALAKKYNILVKFTLQHIRSISTGAVAHPWANSAVLSNTANGPFTDIKEYISTDKGKKFYLDRARALSEKYKNNKYIFGWELWNEMDAVDKTEWKRFSSQMLDSVKRLFPNHLVNQTLGSMDSDEGEQRYKEYFSLSNNAFSSIHRYVDPGPPTRNYSKTILPVDKIVADAIKLARKVEGKPVVMNEIGAVEAFHTGTSPLYNTDTAGMLLHDMIFAPFFCGSASSGATWDWFLYIDKNNLWYHFGRFENAINAIDAARQHFVPFENEQNGLQIYGLKGDSQTMLWCRDSANTWQAELEQHIAPQLRSDLVVDISGMDINSSNPKARMYDPWKDEWGELTVAEGKIILPAFKRSSVIVIDN